MNLRVVERDESFAGELDMRSLTIEYLKQHCRAELGAANIALLDEPQGLEKVQLKLYYGNIAREPSLVAESDVSRMEAEVRRAA